MFNIKSLISITIIITKVKDANGGIQMQALVTYLGHVVDKSKLGILAMAISLGMAFYTTSAIAQSGAGSIQGTVEDQTGAVIPGVSIRVVNRETGVATNSKSNRAGFYQAPNLFTGTYKITVVAQGFKTYKTSIDLLVGQNAVINPVLSPGAVAQQIVVSGNAVQLVTTNSGAISSTLENQRINQLPENGRILTNLIGMATPGLEGSGERANGLPPESLEYVVDGVTAVNRQKGGETNNKIEVPDPDAIQEVKVDLSNSGAELALPATVILTTKSGTNALHGSFFETARNNAIGLAKTRQDPSNFTAPPLVRNEFGASAGGPIILPHVYNGKDKSFWFFAYERYSLAQTTSTLAKVPTLAMRQEDFSGLINKTGVLQKLFDPATTAPSSKCSYTGKSNPYCRALFSNNQIPIGERSPMAKIYYDLVPQPTSDANPLVLPNLTSPDRTYQVIPQVTFRLDHTFNDNNRVYLRYTDNLSNPDITGAPQNVAADGIAAGAAANYYNTIGTNFLTALGYTHIFSPTFFPETIISKQWYSLYTYDGVNPNIDYESMLGLPNNFGEKGFPNIGNKKLIFSFNGSQGSAGGLNQLISNVDENMTKTIGRHQFQFGGRFRHERFALLPKQQSDVITPSSFPTALYNPSSGANYLAEPNTGYVDPSFFLGSVGSYSVTLEPPHVHFHQMEFDAYFQDNYHMSKNFTVNLGFRGSLKLYADILIVRNDRWGGITLCH